MVDNNAKHPKATQKERKKEQTWVLTLCIHTWMELVSKVMDEKTNPISMRRLRTLPNIH
jgi:hypothetical protein